MIYCVILLFRMEVRFMYIRNIAFNHSHDSDFFIDRPNGSGDNLFLLLKSPGIFNFGNGDVISQGNSFVLYTEGFPQTYRVLGSHFTNDWLHFKFEDEDKVWFDKLNIPTNCLTTLDFGTSLSLLINNISYEFYTESSFKMEYEDAFLRMFFLTIARRLQANPINNKQLNNLAIIRNKIYSTPYEDWCIENFAHQLTMSRSNFQHLYKKHFGVTPIEDVINSRIQLAKVLLQGTSTSVYQISHLCGYKCETHFMRQFKKLTGITPSSYRKRNQFPQHHKSE